MQTTRSPRVAVIGAGLSGLAAAAALRAEGAEVTVFESTAAAGGLVRTETVDGHRFDTGATVLTMPELIVDVLERIGLSRVEALDRLALRPLDPGYVMNYADGTSLGVPRDARDLPRAADEAFGAGAGRGVPGLLRWLRDVYDAEFDVFIDRNYRGPRDLAGAPTRRAAAALVGLGALGGLTGAVARFTDDERLQRAFTFQALYAGVPPHRARAIYGIIADMDIGRGLSAPDGGMGRIGRVLASALAEAGVHFEYQTPVTAIRRCADGRVAAVAAAGQNLAVDAVVATLERDGVARLLGERPPRRRLRYSPSAVVVHGVLPTEVTASWRSGHHTIDFGRAWTSTFAEITARRGRVMSDGSFLITRPGAGPAGDPAFVVDGVESVSVLAPTPNLESADLDWDRVAAPYVAEFLAELDARGYPGMADLRIARIDHPRTWARAGLPAGTPFSVAHTLGQTGPLRPRNVWRSAPNLIVAGSGTVPGVGIPPVLVSGRLAAERVLDAVHPTHVTDGSSAHV